MKCNTCSDQIESLDTFRCRACHDVVDNMMAVCERKLRTYDLVVFHGLHNGSLVLLRHGNTLSGFFEIRNALNRVKVSDLPEVIVYRDLSAEGEHGFRAALLAAERPVDWRVGDRDAPRWTIPEDVAITFTATFEAALFRIPGVNVEALKKELAAIKALP